MKKHEKTQDTLHVVAVFYFLNNNFIIGAKSSNFKNFTLYRYSVKKF